MQLFYMEQQRMIDNLILDLVIDVNVGSEFMEWKSVLIYLFFIYISRKSII